MTAEAFRPVSLEDLRPRSLDRIVGQAEAIGRLRSLAEGAKRRTIVPTHLIFHGPPGVGKTTAARAFAREVLGDEFENSFHELRSYDDRSFERVRDGIAAFAVVPPSRSAPFRVVFIDEADELDPKALGALRPALEGERATTVFLLACNDLDRISKPIRSRCTVLEFSALSVGEMRKVLEDAAALAPVSVPGAVLDSIAARADGIPREAVKLLIEELGTLPGPGPTDPTPA